MMIVVGTAAEFGVGALVELGTGADTVAGADMVVATTC
jgi:hypothetical protein